MTGYRHGIISRSARGFTLLEILAATAMFAVIVGGLYAALHGAMRMREETYRRIEKGLPKDYVTEIIRRDIADTVAPVGILAGEFIGEHEGEDETRSDSLEFYTATGTVSDNDEEPWGDIQKVEYYLVEPEDGEGYELVRAITRNLLASETEDPEEQPLLAGVESLAFAYYDGESWWDDWDSTIQDNITPLAVEVRIDFLWDNDYEAIPSPLEILVPIAAEALETESGGETGG